MKVLFSRRRNDFEHVYDLPSVPRVGEYVGLLASPCDSFSQTFVVTNVCWSPDHTAYDVSVRLERVEPTVLPGKTRHAIEPTEDLNVEQARELYERELRKICSDEQWAVFHRRLHPEDYPSAKPGHD